MSKKKIKAEEYMNWDKTITKTLTPLEALENIRKSTHLTYLFTYYGKELDIIETALKRLEKIDNTKLIIVGNPSPNESALNKLINQRMFVGDSREMEIKPLYDESDEKKLKALEIIKKELCIKANDKDKSISFMQYEEQYCDYTILFADTKEEYELLKEILK